MAYLSAVPQPIGVFNNFIAQGHETIVLKEKVMSLTGDSFSIKTADGVPKFQVEGKVMSISGRKTFRDDKGNHLFDICKKHFRLHTTFAIEDPDGTQIMQVKSKFRLVGSKAVATFTSLNGNPGMLMMKGNFFDTTADITDVSQGEGGAVVARIDRKLLSGKDIFFGQQTYAVLVAPGVDMALIAAMCICLDEKRNEGS